MNFIQKYKINRYLKRSAERRKKEEMQVCSLKQARTVCVFHTFESQRWLEQVVKSVRELKKNVSLYCFVPKEKNSLADNREGIRFIFEKDFDFKGSLQKEKLASWQEQSFDMLIDLDRETSLYSLYLSGKIGAKFRIGGSEKAKKQYHLILYSPNKNNSLADYFQSVEEYTKKLGTY